MDPQKRLYLEDPDLLEFEATVVARRPLADGDVGIVLDRTAFYPTSGGQPHDHGTLGGAAVLEVLEAEDGAVVHRMHESPPGPRVHGLVDATRRRDHMQQHSGQHLLSATCVALLGRDTTSFHLGTDRCTIDLPGPPLDAATLTAVERRCNEIVWEARPVRVRLVARQDLGELRKSAPEGVERLRLVEIEGWDTSACCGTHVRSTSAIGLVKILGQEKWGASTRIAFACGARALDACNASQSRVEGLVRLLTCHPDEILERCAKLLQDAKLLRKENERLRAEQVRARAASLLAAAPSIGGARVVVVELQAGGSTALGEMASALVAQGALALLGMRETRAELLFACPEGLAVDLRPAMQRACEAIEGRGGGPPGRVQGAGSRKEGLPGALEVARAEVARQLGERDPF